MLNKHVGINKKTSKMEFSYKKRQNNGGDKPVNCNVDASNCFSAAISKTTDCGKTWELVYNKVIKVITYIQMVFIALVMIIV